MQQREIKLQVLSPLLSLLIKNLKYPNEWQTEIMFSEI